MHVQRLQLLLIRSCRWKICWLALVRRAQAFWARLQQLERLVRLALWLGRLQA
jgi:hypothetical protein